MRKAVKATLVHGADEGQDASERRTSRDYLPPQRRWKKLGQNSSMEILEEYHKKVGYESGEGNHGIKASPMTFPTDLSGKKQRLK